MEVLEYFPTSDKFRVRVLSNGVEKVIGKLSLLFNNEDKQGYQKRLNLAKNLQMNAQEEIRFKNYTTNILNSEIQQMSSQIQDRITKKGVMKKIES